MPLVLFCGKNYRNWIGREIRSGIKNKIIDKGKDEGKDKAWQVGAQNAFPGTPE